MDLCGLMSGVPTIIGKILCRAQSLLTFTYTFEISQDGFFYLELKGSDMNTRGNHVAARVFWERRRSSCHNARKDSSGPFY